jgi:hypothetical protein
MYGTAESRFHTLLTTTLGRGESNARCSASVGASASQAVGTPESVTKDTTVIIFQRSSAPPADDCIIRDDMRPQQGHNHLSRNEGIVVVVVFQLLLLQFYAKTYMLFYSYCQAYA